MRTENSRADPELQGCPSPVRPDARDHQHENDNFECPEAVLDEVLFGTGYLAHATG